MTAESCDRCGVTDETVAVSNACSVCGPTPLCSPCKVDHDAENAVDTMAAATGAPRPRASGPLLIHDNRLSCFCRDTHGESCWACR